MDSGLGEVYELFFDKVYRYVMVRVDVEADAEDITEDVFLKVLKSIGSFKLTGDPFGPWLFRIGHNLVVDFYRKASKHKLDLFVKTPRQPGARWG